MKIHPLKIYCLKNRIKQKEFAKLSGISEITIHRIVNYKTKASKTSVKKISNITGIPIIDLLYPEEEK